MGPVGGLSVFVAYAEDKDGANWALIAGSTFTMNLPLTVLEGLAVSSHNTGALCTVTMDSVSLGTAPAP